MESLAYRIVSGALDIGELFLWRAFKDTGIDWRTMENFILDGFLERKSRGVYQVPGVITPQILLRQAVKVLPKAVASHATAAKIHGLPDAESEELVVSVHASSTHSFDGVRVVRNRDLDLCDVEEIDGVIVTSKLRTILDTALENGYESTQDLLDLGRKQRWFTLGDIQSIYYRVCKRGKPGSAHFRRYISEHRWDPTGSLVDRVVERTLAAELPLPMRGVPIPWQSQHRFSLAYPRAKIALRFIGSTSKHPGWKEKYRSEVDRAKAHGWSLLLISNTDVGARFEMLERELRDLLFAREPG